MRRKRHFSRADANQSPGKIDDWPTAVARIDGRIRLHQIFVLDIVHGDVALHGAKNSATDRTAIANCITNHNHCFSQQVRRNVVQADKWECSLGVNLDKRQVCLVIAGDVVGVVSFPVVRRYVNFQIRGTLDDMLVGDDVTRWINNETGAETLQRLANLARLNAIVTKELRVKILKWITHCSPDHALGVDIYHRW